MHSLYKNETHPGMSSLVFLPLIDMYSGDKMYILWTLHYICKLANEQNVTPIVTFDQPLFWKASEIKNEATDQSAVRNVVFLLGSFHTLMNLIGAIGTLMDGSGIRSILQSVYGENAVVHIMSGKAVQRALRGHLLLNRCITQHIFEKVVMVNDDFENALNDMEKAFSELQKGVKDLDVVMKSTCFNLVTETLSHKKERISIIL